MTAVLNAQGDVAENEEISHARLEALSEKFGVGDARGQQMLLLPALTRMLQDQGRSNEAVELHRKRLATLRDQCEPAGRVLARALLELAKAAAHAGDLDCARENCEELLAFDNDVLDEKGPLRLDAMKLLSELQKTEHVEAGTDNS